MRGRRNAGWHQPFRRHLFPQFSDALDPDDEAPIRDAISHNHFLGNGHFRMK
jgi:hypothetical protein